MPVIWKKKSAAEERKLPKHWSECRDEAEEARWWDANSGRIFDEAVKKGTLKVTTLEEMVKEAKRRARGDRRETKQLTLRLPVEVIHRAKEQAAEAGVPYQVLMRNILAEGLGSGEKRGAPLERKARRR